MQVRKLAVQDAYELVPPTFPDRRGVYCAPFQAAVLADVLGFTPAFVQVSHAVSHRGAVRGPHYADVPPGQAKYAFCTQGSLLDFVVDVRVGSPTFGAYDTVRLDATGYHAVYLAEGLAHAVIALEPGTTLTYLTSTGYNPAAEHGIDPTDPDLGLPLPEGLELILSDKDRSAPSLARALAEGRLPRYEDCLAHYDRLRRAAPPA
ncbi:dTDP-4-dehydrorhamnose 3,5-epimerase [Streptomyces sp. NPDC046831]|uniref:dTDP-4-dehydrorhamnose 3,5-epimerase family protein n=1 Tax=Streptomyces sp. NPDC046831 TaxID=3154805 RepID=UPI0033E4B262